MNRSLPLLAAALFAAGCARTAKPPLDPAAAREAAGKLVEDFYAALAHGDADAAFGLYAPAAFDFGNAPGDAYDGRAPLLAAAHAEWDPLLKAGGSFAVKSRGMRVGLTPDGRAGWVADEAELTVSAGGQRHSSVSRVTFVVGERDGRWWIFAAHGSTAVTENDEVFVATGNKFPPLGPVPDRVDAGAGPIAAAARADLSNGAVLARDVSERSDVFVFGSAPEQKPEGGAAAKQFFLDQAGQGTLRLASGVRAGLAPDGQLGWAAANVALELPDPEHPTTMTVPMRVLLAWLREGGAWRLVQAHFSIALTAPPNTSSN
jgi:ketosteroid isomerase-like protein